ncbi:unnamed protein product [Moneuplotes crassus]|uniref:Uncharacterized protein n=1 Tax=Euplotes crassus TaxID=5936 RepID=A0AAD1XAJ3_EUPCR|nr:unnamed protein product [Moneuplotes crassus]
MEKLRQIIVICKYCPKVWLLVAMKLYYPYMMRKWFKQYKNVAVSEDFDLIYGDHDLEENYEDEGTEIQIHVDTILENPRLDFKLEFFYSDIWLHVYSPRAIREMIALTPKKIDRSDYEKLNFGKLSAYSFEKQRTSKEWKIRREAATKHTPIKRPNDHIKMMLEEIKYGSRKWKSGKTVDITEFLNDLSIEILCMALFGSDFFEESGKCPYINKKNKIKKMDLPEAILYTSDDIDNSYENPMSHHFPMVNEKSLGKPYKRDKKNIQEILKFLSNYLKFKGIFCKI